MDISVHLFRCICHAIHDSFHISLDGSDRCLQIMGNIADQFLIILVKLQLLLSVLLQSLPHGLKILAQIRYLIHTLAGNREVQVPFLDLLGRCPQLIKG